MDNIRSFELKVGLFILTGAIILVFIIFSIGDINISKVGYPLTVTFNFAAGLGTSAPVRLAGVGVGRVDGIKVVYNEKDKRTYAQVHTWIQEGTKIEQDASVTINTLGLLGEKYLEILPGTPGSPLVPKDGVLIGRDPAMMERVTDNLLKISDSIESILEKIRKGEGTIGKLVNSDTVYGDLEGTMANFREFSANLKDFSAKLTTGKGTVGRLLTEDTIYKDMEAFVADLKAHPWKLLSRPRGE
jgi:phospholipid/cholesterol/gamma-HCH transport system substrate-binding protein